MSLWTKRHMEDTEFCQRQQQVKTVSLLDMLALKGWDREEQG